MSEVRPGYRQTEVGVIPEDWKVATLGSIGKFKNGINKPKDAFGSGYPFVNLMDVFGVGKISSNNHLGLIQSNDTDRSVYDLRIGDVLFIRSSVKPSGVGLPTVIIQDLIRTVFSGFLLRFRDQGQLTTGFKEHCFHDERFRAGVIANSTVSANTNINQSALKALAIGYPPSVAEQQAIAEALGDADALIEGLETLVAKKREIKLGAMQELLTGQRRLPGFQGGWTKQKLGSCVTIRNEKVQTRGNPVAVNCVELEQIATSTGRIDRLEDARGRYTVKYRFEPADVLFGRLRPYLRKYWLADVAGVCSTEIWPLRSLDGLIDQSFLFFLVQTAGFISAACAAFGTHMPRADWKMIADYQLTLPPTFDEQRAIAAILSDMDAEIVALEDRLAMARAIKQGMMQVLLTGEIRLI